MDDDSRLRARIKTVLYTTRDALTEVPRDELTLDAIRLRGRRLLEALRDDVERSGDPEAERLFQEAWRLTLGAMVLVGTVSF